MNFEHIVTKYIYLYSMVKFFLKILVCSVVYYYKRQPGSFCTNLNIIILRLITINTKNCFRYNHRIMRTGRIKEL